ncbi:proline-rich receptor-like protein kinase PERK14 [Cryptomeria japonica]|uniref:proline-rich receptor-like protein kinase PERK14 n=1 Tax=Cryptomeria japonica TaxID=3369 RepID=UPI0027DAA2D7|nr:proline-rich receptor-like protein kinase PERK14 [Cryptomeria japonica]
MVRRVPWGPCHSRKPAGLGPRTSGLWPPAGPLAPRPPVAALSPDLPVACISCRRPPCDRRFPTPALSPSLLHSLATTCSQLPQQPPLNFFRPTTAQPPSRHPLATGPPFSAFFRGGVVRHLQASQASPTGPTDPPNTLAPSATNSDDQPVGSGSPRQRPAQCRHLSGPAPPPLPTAPPPLRLGVHHLCLAQSPPPPGQHSAQPRPHHLRPA